VSCLAYFPCAQDISLLDITKRQRLPATRGLVLTFQAHWRYNSLNSPANSWAMHRSSYNNEWCEP